jgi:uncharacterized protein YhdP
LSGSLEASEQGGTAQLRSQQVSIDLPDVFPESSIALDTLNAQAKWKIHQGALAAELSRAEFAGPDAAGSAQGTYRNGGEGPGSIDLTATLTRADARASGATCRRQSTSMPGIGFVTHSRRGQPARPG